MEIEQAIKDLDNQIEEKEAKVNGLGEKLQSAKTFLQQTEPEFFVLQGGLSELKQMRIKLAGKPKPEKVLPSSPSAQQKPIAPQV